MSDVQKRMRTGVVLVIRTENKTYCSYRTAFTKLQCIIQLINEITFSNQNEKGKTHLLCMFTGPKSCHRILPQPKDMRMTSDFYIFRTLPSQSFSLES